MAARLFATIAFGLLCLMASPAGAQTAIERLQPPDTSSPRATFLAYLDAMQEAYARGGEPGGVGSDESLKRAVRTLDVSALPPRLAGARGIEAALKLKEVLDRLDLPPIETIPGAQDGGTAVDKWRLPNTEITIVRVADGPRSGEFLFSAETVRRIREYYDRVEDLPYRDRATPGIYQAYLTTPGRGIVLSWGEWLPKWSRTVIGEQTVWQWISTVITFCVLALLIAFFASLAGRIDRPATEDGQVRPGPRWRPATITALILAYAALTAADWFIDGVINLTGLALQISTSILSLLGFVALATLAFLVTNHVTEVFILARGLDSRAASSRLIRLTSSVVGILLVAGVFVHAAQQFGLPAYSIVTGLGVGGIAIGFGAQTLVRDILSGVLFLVDDAFRVGEYIETGSAKGTVESISIRSMQLRHQNGPLHTVPFGEIKQLTNYSRDWVIMKLPIRLPFGTDTERVRKLIKRLGETLLEDPEIGDKFLEPLKSQGVFQLDDFGIVVRVKFKTRPGEQFVLRRIVYLRIQELFEREGIEFAGREVRVKMTGGQTEPAELPESIKAAAADIGDDDPLSSRNAG